MPSNFKKKVRARMAATGESWQAAQRFVKAQAASQLRGDMVQPRHAPPPGASYSNLLTPKKGE